MTKYEALFVPVIHFQRYVTIQNWAEKHQVQETLHAFHLPEPNYI